MVLRDLDKFCVGAMAWSPDSQQIAFLDDPIPLPLKIWVINRDGTALQMVQSYERPLAYERLTWSPDGRQIVFAMFDGSKALIVNADGSGEPQVRDNISRSWLPNFWPRWSEVE